MNCRYVENGSLARMVKDHGIFPESLAAVYIVQVLEGLIYLHQQGVVHRDIKGIQQFEIKKHKHYPNSKMRMNRRTEYENDYFDECSCEHFDINKWDYKIG